MTGDGPSFFCLKAKGAVCTEHTIVCRTNSPLDKVQ